MKATVTVQYTSNPYGITESIPEGAWKTWGQARTVKGLVRVYQAAYEWTHPQQNAWTGHVRFAVDGKEIGTREALRHLGDATPDDTHLELSIWGKLPRF